MYSEEDDSEEYNEKYLYNNNNNNSSSGGVPIGMYTSSNNDNEHFGRPSAASSLPPWAYDGIQRNFSGHHDSNNNTVVTNNGTTANSSISRSGMTHYRHLPHPSNATGTTTTTAPRKRKTPATATVVAAPPHQHPYAQDNHHLYLASAAEGHSSSSYRLPPNLPLSPHASQLAMSDTLRDTETDLQHLNYLQQQHLQRNQQPQPQQQVSATNPRPANPSTYGSKQHNASRSVSSSSSSMVRSDGEWTSYTHQQFVEAIYDIGVNHASPAVIMEHMGFMSSSNTAPSFAGDDDDNGDADDDNALRRHITSERVKSHLQKYRKNKTKSKEEFRLEYERWMQKSISVVGGILAAARTSLASAPSAVLEMMQVRMGEVVSVPSEQQHQQFKNKNKIKLLGGDMPAFLTFSVLLEDHAKDLMRNNNNNNNNNRGGGFSYDNNSNTNKGGARKKLKASVQINKEDPLLQKRRNGSNANEGDDDQDENDGGGYSSPSNPATTLPSVSEYTHGMSGARISLPTLSEEEQHSPLGVSISHVIGLFYSITHTLIKERRKNVEEYEATLENPPHPGRSSSSNRKDQPPASAPAPPIPITLAETGRPRPTLGAPPSRAATGSMAGSSSRNINNNNINTFPFRGGQVNREPNKQQHPAATDSRTQRSSALPPPNARWEGISGTRKSA